MQTPSIEASLLLGRPSCYTHGGLVYLSHQNTNLVPTTPATGLTPNPSSNATRNGVGTVARRHDGLLHLPFHNTEAVSTTPAIDPTFNQTAGPSSGIAPTFNPIAGPSSGVTQMNTGVVSRGGGGSAYSRGSLFSLGSPPFGSNTRRTTATPEQVVEVSTPSSHTPDHPHGPLVLSRRLTITDGQNSHTSQTDGDHAHRGRTPTPLSSAAGSNAETPRAPDFPYVNDPPISPTTPTSTSSGHQRRRSRSSNASGQEIPRMLGEMREVIGTLAMSVNGLKDVVSDLQAGQSRGPGTTPVRGSGRGRVSGGRRGGNGNRGVQGGVGGGSQHQSTGGLAGDDYVADDEGQGDEDREEPKNYKLRVSVVPSFAFCDIETNVRLG